MHNIEKSIIYEKLKFFLIIFTYYTYGIYILIVGLIILYRYFVVYVVICIGLNVGFCGFNGLLMVISIYK